MNHTRTTNAPDSPLQQSAACELIERLMTEGLIGSCTAARLLGSSKNGRPVHASTIVRWALKGVRTLDGRTVQLEATRVGGRLMTSRAAIVRFIALQAETTAAPPSLPRGPGERHRASEAASRKLEEAGA